MSRVPGPVLITGGCGFIGVGVAKALLAKNPDYDITLTDLFDHPRRTTTPETAGLRYLNADLGDPQALEAVFDKPYGTIFHFASLVSGGAEKDFDLGMKANVHATMYLLEAARKLETTPRVIFTSSIATFGGEKLPETIDDWTWQHPQNSYGVAKVVGEQLLNDYSRKGFLCGRALRLAAIVIRDEPNSAASGYASSIARAPLRGEDFVCPVTPETQLPIMSDEACIHALIDVAALPGEQLGDYRGMNGPNIAPSAQELADSVMASAPLGEKLGTIRFEPDEAVMAIVKSWPKVMKFDRAKSFGLKGDVSFTDILDRYRTRNSP